MSESSLRSPLARVTGLGSAKDGVRHWWMQRVTAVAMVPLGIWFVVSIASLAGADHAQVTAWLGAPLPALLMVLFLVAALYHLKLGVQVVIEDYVHTRWLEITLLLLNTFGCILIGAASVLAVLSLLFGG